MGRLTALLVLALLGGLLFVEVTMRPTSGERFVFAAIFGALALLALLTTPLLLHLARRSRRFRDALTVAASTAVFVGVAVVAVAAAGMFLSDHDLRLTLVSLATGTLVAIAQLWALTGALSSDLRDIEATVADLAAGNLGARVALERNDELGRLGDSVDQLAERLAELESTREADDASRRELMANIGHDLRTPLASMRLAVEAIQDEMTADPQAYLRSIAKDVDHLSQLVDDLFLISQLDAGARPFHASPIELVELADETIEAMTPVADSRGVKLVLDAISGVGVHADAVAVGRTLRNLVDNATRHAVATVTVHVRESDGYAIALVRDDGPGFPEGMDPFERFVRGDEARARDGAGAGLGLAIARRLAEATGGSLSILPGPGGAVQLTLPAS